MDETLTRTAVLDVHGMTCEDCAHHVGAALSDTGAVNVAVSLAAGEARFSWPQSVSESALRTAVSDAGYGPGALRLTDRPRPTGRHGALRDLVIVGSGSGAFAAAIKAADAGYRPTLVEHGTLGGTCVNVGCVPSKALIRAGELAWGAAHHPFTGVHTSSGPADLAALVAQKDRLVGELRARKYERLADDYGFEVIRGHGRFTGPDTLEVDGRPLHARRFLIATGAEPQIPQIPGLADSGYLTSTTALELATIPGRLAVIGASSVGLELGQLFSHLGSKVTLIDAAGRIAPAEEPEVSQTLTTLLKDQGVDVYTDARILKVDRPSNAIHITLDVNGARVNLAADQLLVAAGRRPNTGQLALDAAGVKADGRGAIIVDPRLRTSNPAIYAAGDVTGAPQFVYVAAYQGALAAENALLDAARTVDLAGLPRVTFTTPQIAAAGLSETQAKATGLEVETSLITLDAVPRALANHDTRGLVKLVAEAGTGRLVGASILAENAGEVIQAAVLAIRHQISTQELADTLHPYLTIAEGLKLAAQTFSRDVTKLSCCAA